MAGVVRSPVPYPLSFLHPVVVLSRKRSFMGRPWLPLKFDAQTVNWLMQYFDRPSPLHYRPVGPWSPPPLGWRLPRYQNGIAGFRLSRKKGSPPASMVSLLPARKLEAATTHRRLILRGEEPYPGESEEALLKVIPLISHKLNLASLHPRQRFNGCLEVSSRTDGP
jgi:hypothetical protein